MSQAERLIKLAGNMRKIGQKLPGAKYVQDEYEVLESAVLGELRDRMVRANTQRQPRLASQQGTENHGSADAQFEILGNRFSESPAERLQAMLNDAMEQDIEEARREWAHRMLDQLTSDEVRLLGALSDGSKHPMVHVGASASMTGSREIVRGYFSSVGKNARLKVRELVPIYVRHLIALGLAEQHGEEGSMEVDYQILEVENGVMHSIEAAKQSNMHRIKPIRHTLMISELGKQFWNLCNDIPALPG